MFKSESELKPNDEVPKDVQESARERVYERQREERERSERLASEIEHLRKAHRQEFGTILGTENVAAYAELRAAARREMRDMRTQVDPETPQGEAQIQRLRCRLINETDEFLARVGTDFDKLLELRQDHNARLQALVPSDLLNIPEVEIPTTVIDDTLSPTWTIYTPPYAGFFWSLHAEWSDESDEPALDRHLDPTTGQIGSSIRLRVKGADNSDDSSAEYYTTNKLWHQTTAAGQLEGFMVLGRRTAARFEAKVSDEFGFSTATMIHGCNPQLRVLDPDETWDIQSNFIWGKADFTWGDGVSWEEHPIRGKNIHWYYFKTERSYSAGAWLLLEAALLNWAWFEADDMSVTLDNDLDLSLLSVRVRSVDD